ncbi:hypothetical protein E9993_14795 [Labilibacter sediminis]|nr:hypothetical protein E9993_14795 [Labilibacter sediminis]
MNPFVDQSDDEFSIHCLEKDDLSLLQDAIHLIWEQFPVTNPETKPTRVRLSKLNNALNEYLK